MHDGIEEAAQTTAEGPLLDIEAAAAPALALRPRSDKDASRAGERTSTAGWSGGGGGGTLSIRPTFQGKGNPRPEASRRGLRISNGPSEPALSVGGSGQAEGEPRVLGQEQLPPSRSMFLSRAVALPSHAMFRMQRPRSFGSRLEMQQVEDRGQVDPRRSYHHCGSGSELGGAGIQICLYAPLGVAASNSCLKVSRSDCVGLAHLGHGCQCRSAEQQEDYRCSATISWPKTNVASERPYARRVG